MEKALIIAGGDNKDILIESLYNSDESYKVLIAVDRGLEILDKLQIKPDYILGDFDSVSEKIINKYINRNDISIIKHAVEKDASDTELALDLCAKLGIKEVTIAGATGNRADHELANIRLTYYYKIKGMNVTLIDQNNKIYCADSSFSILNSGQYVSFFPIGEAAVLLTLENFKYEIDRVQLNYNKSPTFAVGNNIIADSGNIIFDSGYLIVIESID